MNIEEFRNYCLAKKGVTEDFPFDVETLVFKVMGKMFALTNIDHFESVNLKCDPDFAIELREKYLEITAGFHMNKRHWNTVNVSGILSNSFLMELIDHSYDMVVQKLPKAKQALLTGD